MKCGKTIVYNLSCLRSISRWTNHDLFERGADAISPTEFPKPPQRVRRSSFELYVRRRPIVPKELLKPVFILVPVSFVLEEHDAANDIHGVVDQQIPHVGMERIVPHLRRDLEDLSADRRGRQASFEYGSVPCPSYVIGNVELLEIGFPFLLQNASCERFGVEPQGKAAAIVGVSTPLVQIVSVAAETTDEEMPPLRFRRQHRNAQGNWRRSRLPGG